MLSTYMLIGSTLICFEIIIKLTCFVSRFEGHIEICPPGMSHSACSVNKSVLEAIRGRLGSFHELLLEPPKVGQLPYARLGRGWPGQ